MEKRHHRIERRLELRHDELCDALRHLGVLARRQNGDSARLHGLRDERVPVDMHARNGDEQRPRLHLARIVLDARDFFINTYDLGARNERSELAEFLHGCGPPRFITS